MRYHDLPGKRPPIVFIHGLGCAGSFDYPGVASQPALADRRRILVDLVGSGFSDKPRDFGYTVSDHAACLEALVSSLNLDRFTVYGHSLGGAVALALADRCRDRLDRIVLSEANLDPGGGPFSRAIAAYTEDDFVARGFDETLEQSRRSSHAMWAASCAVTSPVALYRGAVSLIAGQRPSWRETLYALECPKAFLFGEYSLPDPDFDVLRDYGIQIEVVPGAGHSMAWENPQGLAHAIRRALDGA